jgi:hypothetical protein
MLPKLRAGDVAFAAITSRPFDGVALVIRQTGASFGDDIARDFEALIAVHGDSNVLGLGPG